MIRRILDQSFYKGSKPTTVLVHKEKFNLHHKQKSIIVFSMLCSGTQAEFPNLCFFLRRDENETRVLDIISSSYALTAGRKDGPKSLSVSLWNLSSAIHILWTPFSFQWVHASKQSHIIRHYWKRELPSCVRGDKGVVYSVALFTFHVPARCV
jgi:hypothetical protein